MGLAEARRSSDGDTTLRIGAVVLAAGASSRMGRNKMLLEVDGVPMVRRTVRRVINSGVTRTVVVLGHEADRVREALDAVPCEFAESPDYTGPTSGSLHAGLGALAAHGTQPVDAALVMLGDMVHVTEHMLGTIVDSARESHAPLVVSRYGKGDKQVLAPPLLFRRTLWPELLAWHGEGCGKAVVMAHRREALMIDWPSAALQDIDTPADYEALTR